MRKSLLIAVSLGLGASRALAQSPDTDVFLAPITRLGDSIVVGTPVNITHRAGYDNQPAFTADSRSVLYTAQSDGQTDIWRYDIGTKRTVRVTRTPESEYSATPIPGERRFSAIRVERDSTQRLWSFAANGADARLVLTSLKPVGYHGWLTSTRLAAYVLGVPSTLHLINRDGTRDTIIARDVGRAVQPLEPGKGPRFSYAQRDSAGHLTIFYVSGRPVSQRFGHQRVTLRKEAGNGTGATRTTLVDSVATVSERPYALIAAPFDNEFHAWTPDIILVSATSSVLVRWNGLLGSAAAWIPIADLKPFGVRNVSRIAFSPDGWWVAFVAEPTAP